MAYATFSEDENDRLSKEPMLLWSADQRGSLLNQQKYDIFES